MYFWASLTTINNNKNRKREKKNECNLKNYLAVSYPTYFFSMRNSWRMCIIAHNYCVRVESCNCLRNTNAICLYTYKFTEKTLAILVLFLLLLLSLGFNCSKLMILCDGFELECNYLKSFIHAILRKCKVNFIRNKKRR